MVFSSTLFLFIYLPIVLIGYYILRGQAKNYWLLFVSLVFFGWSQPNYLWIILLNIAINYTGAMLIDKIKSIRKITLLLTVIANLAILFYFKYFDFAIESVNQIFGTTFSLRDIVLPIGISFFTFQGMSYVIDVYRKDVTAQKNIFKLGLYIVLFPQLIAGPIVRYKDIAQEIDKRHVNVEDFYAGIEKFIIGLGKKAIIANTMALTADAIWNNGVSQNTWIMSWVGSIAYTLQIYFDFSGYSDMAIGLGRMFGFHFNENFNLPYISKNITEFWRRWHISLSSWFRDYVYIPLGGNRKNVYLNLAIVFLLTGVWHGAAWNFIVWGIWNGVFILIERVIRMKNKKKEIQKKQNRGIIFLQKLYTLMVVNLGWVLFRAPDLETAIDFMKSMFGIIHPEKVSYTIFWYLDKWTITVMILAVIFASSIPTWCCEVVKKNVNESGRMIGKYIILIALFLFAVIRIVSGTYNPFIYFQF
ncbi:MBOAT family protein [Eubacterium ramulus]|uniref:MBOAT family O-acyltransferase n=1 Tax=Eubacterium ramulus TaxID=39490 RepID=UPI003522CE2D